MYLNEPLDPAVWEKTIFRQHVDIGSQIRLHCLYRNVPTRQKVADDFFFLFISRLDHELVNSVLTASNKDEKIYLLAQNLHMIFMRVWRVAKN